MSSEKVRENRLRRMALRQRLVLQKIRRRDPRAADYGRYWLRDIDTGATWYDQGPIGLSLDDVEEWLTSDERGGDDAS